MFVRTVEIPIYNIDIVMVINDDFNAVDRKFKLQLKEEYAPDDPNDCIAITHQHPDNYTEIYVLLDPNNLDFDTFSHELLHTIGKICIIRGIEHDPVNEEPLAYLQGYVSDRMMRIVVSYLDLAKMDIRKFLAPDLK